MVDKEKVELKKAQGFAQHKDLKDNKQRLKELSNKASVMFQNIKEIQKIMNEKFVGLDKSVISAEQLFKKELEEAIQRGKTIKRELLQNIRQQHFMPRLNLPVARQI